MILCDEIEQSYVCVVCNFKCMFEVMSIYLCQQGLLDWLIKCQIEGELVWSCLLCCWVELFVNVSDDEVQVVIVCFEVLKGVKEYCVGEIYLLVIIENQNEVVVNVCKIIEQIKQGGLFVVYVWQFLEVFIVLVGGDLGWVCVLQLFDSFVVMFGGFVVGQFVGFIQMLGGFLIVYFVDSW